MTCLCVSKCEETHGTLIESPAVLVTAAVVSTAVKAASVIAADGVSVVADVVAVVVVAGEE